MKLISGRIALTVFVLFTLVFGLLVLKQPVANAQQTACSFSVSPAIVKASNYNQLFNFNIENKSSNDTHRINIIRPSDNFFINGFRGLDSYVGTFETSASQAAIYGPVAISAQGSGNFQLDVATGIKETAAMDWRVQVSSNSNGSNSIECSGALIDTAVNGYAPPEWSSGAYNVVTGNIASTSVTIDWDTGVETSSMVVYDTSNVSYSSKNILDATTSTHHSQTLSGLKPSSSYHFMVLGADSDGRPYYSDDSTFITSERITSGELPNNDLLSNITNISGTANSTTSIKHKFTKKETSPPLINLITNKSSSQIYKQAPIISGQASDDQSVFAIEYSLDGGNNWLSSDKSLGLGTKNVSFEFTPLNLVEGSYKLLVRAVDSSGNIGTTPITVLVIDRLPPQIGGSILTLGPQVLETGTDGKINILSGVDEKITLSAVGGPSSIILNATNSKLKTNSKSFSMTQSADTGLWSGIISFKNPGIYSLVATSMDGAGNKIVKTINKVSVASAAKVVDSGGRPVIAKVTAYYLDTESESWVIWDGRAYGQDNPQLTKGSGVFNLFLPAGNYYLKASGHNFATITSSFFKLETPSPVITTLKVSRYNLLLPIAKLNFSIQKVDIALPNDGINSSLNDLVGSSAPDFNLTSSEDQVVRVGAFRGRSTILSFMSSWAPTTSEQLPALEYIANDKSINVVPIALQQSSAEIQAYQSLGGYGLVWLADPDGNAGISYGISALPTHIFIDEHGIVKMVASGLLTKQQLLENLSSL